MADGGGDNRSGEGITHHLGGPGGGDSGSALTCIGLLFLLKCGGGLCLFLFFLLVFGFLQPCWHCVNIFWIWSAWAWLPTSCVRVWVNIGWSNLLWCQWRYWQRVNLLVPAKTGYCLMRGGCMGRGWLLPAMVGVSCRTCRLEAQGGWKKRVWSCGSLMFGGGCWSVLVVGKGTDSNFLYWILARVQSRLVFCVDFWYFLFHELHYLPGASATAKHSTGVVCGVREQPEALMVVPQDYCQRNMVLAATKTVLGSQSCCFSDAPVPHLLRGDCNWLWSGVVDFGSVS